MKARKFKVNLKSCAGTFFYSQVVLIFGGLFLFFFVFMMEIKKYCQPGVYIPCFRFSCFYRSMYSINDTQQPSEASFLQKSLTRIHLLASLSPCILIYRMVGSYTCFSEVNRTQILVPFAPWRSCLGHIKPACYWCNVGSYSPCWTYQMDKKVWIYLGQFS